MIQLIQIGKKEAENYDTAEIMSDTDLHRQVYSLFKDLDNLSAKKNRILVLDIAAGKGAFSNRLHDMGYIVEAVDIDDSVFKYKDTIKFHSIDLNDLHMWERFVISNKNKFDIITSIETIEHLESPWVFLRGLRDLLKPAGHLILTTPNIENPFSKLLFFFRSRFYQFMENDLSYGHINPLTSFEITTICSRIGFGLSGIFSGGSYPIIWIHKNISFSIVWSLINIFSVPLVNKKDLSWCKIYLLEKIQEFSE